MLDVGKDTHTDLIKWFIIFYSVVEGHYTNYVNL